MRLPLALSLACLASGAHAVEDFSHIVTLSTLSATVANNALNVMEMPNVVLQGNAVSNVSVGSFGIIGIVQGTGAQSNVQQTITVNIGSLNFMQAN
jgi:hypothetical protein